MAAPALNQKCLLLPDLNPIKFVEADSRVAKYERLAPLVSDGWSDV